MIEDYSSIEWLRGAKVSIAREGRIPKNILHLWGFKEVREYLAKQSRFHLMEIELDKSAIEARELEKKEKENEKKKRIENDKILMEKFLSAMKENK